ncbi:MAG: potassium channel family protein, partial [Bacteroidota bacterium]
ELSEKTSIVTTADSDNSIDILQLAGSDFIIEPRKMVASAFARRTLGGNALASIIGEFENLIIAEAPAMGTPMVGKTLAQLGLRKKVGINVAGFWDKGNFLNPDPKYVINDSTVLVLIGTQESIDLYNELFIIFETNPNPVILIGSGRVGKYVAKELEGRDIDYKIIEKDEQNNAIPNKTIIGNAADLRVLKEAGIYNAPSVIISTSDDDMNVYLTLYCRKLRPDIQIISRANSDKNVSTLARAGANLIMSYPSLTANAVFNFMKQNKILMLSEGIDIFSVTMPEKLVGRNLLDSQIRENTGCTVIALKRNGEVIANPNPANKFERDNTLLLLGTEEAEAKFMKMYS